MTSASTSSITSATATVTASTSPETLKVQLWFLRAEVHRLQAEEEVHRTATTKVACHCKRLGTDSHILQQILYILKYETTLIKHLTYLWYYLKNYFKNIMTSVLNEIKQQHLEHAIL
jgi:hypothetical protein